MTDSLKPEMESRKSEPTPGLAVDREVPTKQLERNPIISIDLRIRVRRAKYRVDFVRVLKWISTLLVIGLRMYQLLHT
jgi:hypothetical protein